MMRGASTHRNDPDDRSYNCADISECTADVDVDNQQSGDGSLDVDDNLIAGTERAVVAIYLPRYLESVRVLSYRFGERNTYSGAQAGHQC